MRILAFKADADFWCPRCAQEVYPGCLTADVDDREGNLVCPIFEGADNLLLERCCRCGDELDPPPAEIEDEVHAILSDLAGHGTDLTASDIIDLAWRRHVADLEELEKETK